MAIKDNEDEDTYAPMDLFDWLNIISGLRDEGLTQAQIGARIGWSREAVRNYIILADKVGTQVLDLAKQRQTGRVPENGTTGTFTFTEGWFRNSGLYDLPERYQERLIKEFTADKCNWDKKKLQDRATKYKLWSSFLDAAQQELINPNDFDVIAKMVEQNIFKTPEQLRAKIAALNEKAKHSLLHGDCIKIMDTMEPGSIDVIITDPPYPKEYLPLYEEMVRCASKILKPGGSLVVMVGQSYLPEIFTMLTAHLNYNWMLAYLTPGGQSAQLWDRNVNTFFKPVLWFVKGEYEGKWVGDVIKSAVNDNDKTHHEWGQSKSGMAELVEKLSTPGDVILDPFMGGGTTGYVVVKSKRTFIGIEIDKSTYETAKARIGEVIAAMEGANYEAG